MTSPSDDPRRADDEDLDPADRPEPSMRKAMDEAGVPRSRRARNAGGDMSETQRSRVDEPNQVRHLDSDESDSEEEPEL